MPALLCLGKPADVADEPFQQLQPVTSAGELGVPGVADRATFRVRRVELSAPDLQDACRVGQADAIPCAPSQSASASKVKITVHALLTRS
jgi:hypothetical protein